MKQIGIIYKFTIIAKYKFNGHKPFYVGQHFGIEGFDTYPGSGVIWTDFITRLKSDFPTCWRKLIKREVLYQRPCSQKCLDKMEEYFIKKEKAHYSYKSGGCNILWGTANNFGSGSPVKDPLVREKISKKMKGKMIGSKNPFFKKKHSDRTKKIISIKRLEYYKHNVPYNLGKTHTEESKRKMSEAQRGEKSWMYGRKGELCHNFGRKISKETKAKISKKLSGKNNPNYGKRWSDEIKRKISEHHADVSGKNNPMYGKRGKKSPMFGRKWINNGIEEKFVKIDSLPEGYLYGRLSSRVFK